MLEIDRKKHEKCQKRLDELFENYVDGKEVFIKAQATGTWDYPATLKEGVVACEETPDNILALVERVCAIINEEKYGLNTYANKIDVITDDQMLDQYASNGMPVSYNHWSKGLERAKLDQQYEQGMGLAYEIVINTDPAIAYCMESNSMMMMMLVIAHASFGHNSFFKSNYMFKNYTEAHNIIQLQTDLRDFLIEAEKHVGIDEVEEFMDSVHALSLQSVTPGYTMKDDEASLQTASDAHTSRGNEFFTDLEVHDEFNRVSKAENSEQPLRAEMEQNLLLYIAENSPNLPKWKRHVMRMVAEERAYFFPQMQTQVMNEGWASYWHYTFFEDFKDFGLVDDGMMLEFKASHTAVVRQPGAFETVTVMGPDGQPQEVPIYNGINPYALGFAMMNDIKRIVNEPTEEDKEHFPELAGKGYWLDAMKHAMENFRDESFIQQYLSPKVQRDFKFFDILDDPNNENLVIQGIHAGKGFDQVRQDLAAQYRLSEKLPMIGAYENYDKTDRRLVLRHEVNKGRPLGPDTEEVVKHMKQLWGYPVILESVDEKGRVVNKVSAPANYGEEDRAGRRLQPRYRKNGYN